MAATNFFATSDNHLAQIEEVDLILLLQFVAMHSVQHIQCEENRLVMLGSRQSSIPAATTCLLLPILLLLDPNRHGNLTLLNH